MAHFTFKVITAEFCSVICLGLALRAIVSLHAYSGHQTPPMYGDYEAQRHWQELTVNLSPIEWYSNSTRNDLMYWGLDYPPLTAYHSYIMGKIAFAINASYVELHTSKGLETTAHKSFMRLTVLVADIIIYIPSAVLYALSVGKLVDPPSNLNTLQMLLILLIYPGQILIDNGHFQYNNVSLGLTSLAIACIIWDCHLLSAFLFTLALNYKQMELYHALPFFIYLLHICLTKKRCILYLFILSCVVILTCLLLWIPWLISLDSFNMVIDRIFPLTRGVFEDKVANFWCAVNVIIKLKQIFTNQHMGLLCFLATLVSFGPSAISLFRKPTKWNFICALFNSALSFYLFSFQVHEKSILLTALPAIGLYNKHPNFIIWYLQITTYSMVPLLDRDGIILPFLAMHFIFHVVFDLFNVLMISKSYIKSKTFSFVYTLSNCINFCLISCCLFAKTLYKYPYLYTLILMLFDFLHFSISLCYFTYFQMI